MNRLFLLLLALAAAMIDATVANAQRIKVVDSNGQAVPYATVMNPDAAFIGITGMDGVLADVKGAKTVTITHVAYKTLTVTIGTDGQQVTLEDVDYDLPEITVTKKDYTYLQVYYRTVAISKDGLIFYRAGLVDNFYNEEKGKLETSKQHFTKAKSATLKTAINLIMGFIVNEKATIHPQTVEERLLQAYKKLGLKIVNEGEGRKRIIDNYGTLGSIIDQNGQRRIMMDENQAYLHYLEAAGKTKELEKRRKKDAKIENAMSSSFCVYNIDENGNYRPEDFVMERSMDSSDHEKYGHCIFIMDFFATDCGYYSKEGIKQLKKENKVKMNYDGMQQFERQHNIPALAPEILAKVKGLSKGDE